MAESQSERPSVEQLMLEWGMEFPKEDGIANYRPGSMIYVKDDKTVIVVVAAGVREMTKSLMPRLARRPRDGAAAPGRKRAAPKGDSAAAE